MPILAKQGRLEDAPDWYGTPLDQLDFEWSEEERLENVETAFSIEVKQEFQRSLFKTGKKAVVTIKKKGKLR